MNPGRYAAVDWIPTAGPTIAASIQAWSVAGADLPAAGLNQTDAVQLVTDLSVLRHSATMGTVGVFSRYDSAGKWQGRELRDTRRGPVNPAPGTVLVPIVGDEPVRSAVYGQGGLPSNWGALLALALDRCMVQLSQAKQSGEVPQGYGTLGVPVMAPAVVAIIVGGSALAVIGSVAAWRYLDPQLRTRIAEVRAASADYQARLEAWKTTGIMPPPSPVETANAKAVEDGAREQKASDWTTAALVGGGIVLGGIALSAIRYAFSPREAAA